jgi:hypothetical protein
MKNILGDEGPIRRCQHKIYCHFSIFRQNQIIKKLRKMNAYNQRPAKIVINVISPGSHSLQYDV